MKNTSNNLSRFIFVKVGNLLTDMPLWIGKIGDATHYDGLIRVLDDNGEIHYCSNNFERVRVFDFFNEEKKNVKFTILDSDIVSPITFSNLLTLNRFLEKNGFKLNLRTMKVLDLNKEKEIEIF